MIKISNAELKILNNDFCKFKNRIVQSKKKDNTYFITQLGHYQKKYRKAGLENTFADNIFGFAQNLSKRGVDDLPGIIFSALMKMPLLKDELKELYALKAIEYAKEKDDSIHVLARLVDLEKLYRQSKNTHKYTRILFQEEKELIKICSNFRSAKKNYKTYSRVHSSLRKYEMELAKTRVDIAKVILKTNPKQAEILLEKAQRIFEREGRNKEVEFTKTLLSQIVK